MHPIQVTPVLMKNGASQKLQGAENMQNVKWQCRSQYASTGDSFCRMLAVIWEIRAGQNGEPATTCAGSEHAVS